MYSIIKTYHHFHLASFHLAELKVIVLIFIAWLNQQHLFNRYHHKII